MKTQLLLAALVVVVGAKRADAVPEQIGLTARVVDAGTPITGAHTFTIRIFDAATGGAQQWTENDAATANDGTVYLTLGDQSALDATVLDGGPLWIELQVDSTVLAPRLSITSAAYAVRAGVAEDAELLGGMPSTSFLPKGSVLNCTGTQKVIGISANGSVVCGADQDTILTLAGSGAATTAARSDHNHTGVYLPLGTALTCAGTQKVTGINANGSVSCGVDVDTDTNTSYTAGSGLTLTTNTFSVNFAGTGTATTAARSDHTHAELCPSGYSTYSGNSGAGSPLCIQRVVNALTWNNAASDCFVNHAAGELCTYSQLRIATQVSPSLTLSAGFWMADRVDDNWVLRVNGTNSADFDEAIEIQTTTVVGPGYYCCQRAH